MNIKQEDAIYVQISPDNPAVTQDGDLCEDCGHCGAICQEEMNVLGHLRDGKGEENLCIHCGQCSAACPEQAIKVKSEVELVKQAIQDPQKIVVFSTSPSVRVGIGDEFLEKAGTYSEGKMVAALRALGANYVMDVTFSADLTIMEEGMELLYRLGKGQKPLPQFTSCCPGWVKYVELFHPELLGNLSTAKSPIGMQGAIIKTYFARKKGIRPENIVNVAVTPCTAKKFEIRRPELKAAAVYNDAPGMRDNDFVITTKELVSWMQEEQIDFSSLKDSQFDDLLGKGSGAGVIFGSTGGVMEAALRMAYECLTGESAPDLLLDFHPVRGLSGIKEAELEVAGLPVKVAVVYGTDNAEMRCIDGSDLILELSLCVLCLCGFLRGPQTLFQGFACSSPGFGREDVLGKENLADGRFRDTDRFPFLQELGEMAQIGVLVFGVIQAKALFFYGIGNGTGRPSAAVAMDKSSLAFCVVPGNEPVDMSERAAKFSGCTMFVAASLD